MTKVWAARMPEYQDPLWKWDCEEYKMDPFGIHEAFLPEESPLSIRIHPTGGWDRYKFQIFTSDPRTVALEDLV